VGQLRQHTERDRSEARAGRQTPPEFFNDDRCVDQRGAGASVLPGH
jgi:hypothetical protein